jgi:hypothetical protein
MTDRSQWPTRKIRLEDDTDPSDVAHLTPSERVAMVWELTRPPGPSRTLHFVNRDFAEILVELSAARADELERA